MLDTLEVKLASPVLPLARGFALPTDAFGTSSRIAPGGAAAGNKIRPLGLSVPLPNALKAAKSRVFLSLVVVGRAGDGDVAKNSIKSAASLSEGSGRGVVETLGSLEAPPTGV